MPHIDPSRERTEAQPPADHSPTRRLQAATDRAPRLAGHRTGPIALPAKWTGESIAASFLPNRPLVQPQSGALISRAAAAGAGPLHLTRPDSFFRRRRSGFG